MSGGIDFGNGVINIDYIDIVFRASLHSAQDSLVCCGRTYAGLGRTTREAVDGLSRLTVSKLLYSWSAMTGARWTSALERLFLPATGGRGILLRALDDMVDWGG